MGNNPTKRLTNLIVTLKPKTFVGGIMQKPSYVEFVEKENNTNDSFKPNFVLNGEMVQINSLFDWGNDKQPKSWEHDNTAELHGSNNTPPVINLVCQVEDQDSNTEYGISISADTPNLNGDITLFAKQQFPSLEQLMDFEGDASLKNNSYMNAVKNAFKLLFKTEEIDIDFKQVAA